MERTPHVLLVGEGALKFALAQGFKKENLLTEKAREIWLRWKKEQGGKGVWPPAAASGHPPELRTALTTYGTINCIALEATGRLAGVSKQELIDTLYDFLLGLIPLKASAVLIIDEAQNLPLQVLEQIRILSNLETDKEKLLQIILVGQLNLQTLLRSPELRQLDQRVSIRYELKPLDAETVAAYVAHRLTIAGGSASVAFTAKALALVHRISGGIPRLINLLCDRALPHPGDGDGAAQKFRECAKLVVR
jgi:DNA transposition AAA+ family ATPase